MEVFSSKAASQILASLLCLVHCCAAAATVRFAIIGDYGNDSADELNVANLVKTNLQPQFILTAGDNNYGTAAQIDQCIGKYYHSFIGNYSGSFGGGASSNRFFPALGNHDFNSTGYGAHLSYFTLPGNERYYQFRAGPVEIFICNSDVNEPDGTSSTSVQARTVSNWMARATAPWKIVIIHDPPYSSSESIAASRWPFRQWGAHAVISGDSHHYERLEVNGLAYFVNGSGGAALAGFGTPLPESRVRYNADHGAMLVLADDSNLTLHFYSVANGGRLVDSITLVQPRLTVRRASGGTLRISWATNAAGFALQSRTNLSAGTWANVGFTPGVESNQFVLYTRSTNTHRFFRLQKP